MLESGIPLHFPHLFWTEGLQIFSVWGKTLPSNPQNILNPKDSFIELCNDYQAVSKADQQGYTLDFLADI